ncbi:MAG: flagellar hook-associated protein FlgL [Chloroflexota bacterium]|nr:flagellar hook-associated protein FlgL [Dehalococcoidia bacterium]MDW8254884.1 flagellar hook-associated protein FlgL [Chloroflexota bacterium]
MRVTQSMLIGSVIRNLSQSRTKLDDLNDQITSGKRIRKPSDDPTGAAVALSLRARQAQLEAQARGRSAAVAWLNATETALADVSAALIRVKELSVQASNATLDQAARQHIASELDQILNHLVQVGNARLGDRFLFAGDRTDTAPFTRDFSPAGATYSGTTNAVTMRVDVGVEMEVGIPGNQLLPVFAAVAGVIADLQTPGATIEPARLQAVEDAHDAVLTLLATVGAKTNRLQAMEERAGLDNVTLAAQLSTLEDTDFVEAVLDFRTRQTVYEAAMAAGAKIIQPSLLDFLR